MKPETDVTCPDSYWDSDETKTPSKYRVTGKEADDIKRYVNSRHLLEPRWSEISGCIGGLEFDRIDLERELAQKTSEIERLKEIIRSDHE